LHQLKRTSAASGRQLEVRGIVAGVPIYPFLLAAAFVLAFPAANEIRPEAAGRALGFVLVVTTVLVLLAIAIYQDPWFPQQQGMRERFANVVAVYAPGHPELLPDDVTLSTYFPACSTPILGLTWPARGSNVLRSRPGYAHGATG
jgi:hypothetical protein